MTGRLASALALSTVLHGSVVLAVARLGAAWLEGRPPAPAWVRLVVDLVEPADGRGRPPSWPASRRSDAPPEGGPATADALPGRVVDRVPPAGVPSGPPEGVAEAGITVRAETGGPGPEVTLQGTRSVTDVSVGPAPAPPLRPAPLPSAGVPEPRAPATPAPAPAGPAVPVREERPLEAPPPAAAVRIERAPPSSSGEAPPGWTARALMPAGPLEAGVARDRAWPPAWPRDPHDRTSGHGEGPADGARWRGATDRDRASAVAPAEPVDGAAVHGGGAGHGSEGDSAVDTPGAPGRSPVLAAPATDGGGMPREYEGYIRALRARVQERLAYPWLAVRRGQEGTVELEVHLGPDGGLTGVRVVADPGIDGLARAAVRAVHQAAPFPFPEGLGGRPLAVRLPIVFRLR